MRNYPYHRTAKLEKGKLLLKVKSSPLDAMGKKNKKLFYLIYPIMALLAFAVGYLSLFSSLLHFLPLAVIVGGLPLSWKIKTNYGFYERGIKLRARFIPWEDFKSYKKEGDEIILIANIKHFWENLWKGNLYFEDKNGEIEKVVEGKLKKVEHEVLTGNEKIGK